MLSKQASKQAGNPGIISSVTSATIEDGSLRDHCSSAWYVQRRRRRRLIFQTKTDHDLVTKCKLISNMPLTVAAFRCNFSLLPGQLVSSTPFRIGYELATEEMVKGLGDSAGSDDAMQLVGGTPMKRRRAATTSLYARSW